MPAPRTLTGEMTDNHEPVWLPLELVLSPRQLGDFMWMFEVLLADGTRVYAYKHRETRRYAHLSDDGRGFAYTANGRYRETSVLGLVEDALPTDAQVAARDEQSRRDGITEGTTWDPIAMRLDVGLTDEESATLAAYAHPRGLGFHQGLREIVSEGLAKVRDANAAVTTTARLAALPGNLAVPAEVSGLDRDAVVDATPTRDRGAHEAGGPAGELPSWAVAQVDEGLRKARDIAT